MRKVEFIVIAESVLYGYRDVSYERLRELVDGESVRGESRTERNEWYQYVVSAVWDDGPGSNITVSCVIDNGGWRALLPVSAAFIKSKDGKFVGE